ncbi:MAG: hypothetical protein O2968_08270 [Acidobacteria bacterium]|nr:hypothetical protein [Acidobacteriota bacterium]
MIDAPVPRRFTSGSWEVSQELLLLRAGIVDSQDLGCWDWVEQLCSREGCEYGQARGSDSGQWQIDLDGDLRLVVDVRWPEVRAYAPATVGDQHLLQQFLDTACVLLLPLYGWECLHASAVAAKGRVIAFCGDREAGKSSLAAAALQQGADAYGDDALAFAWSPAGEVLAAKLPQYLRPREPARSAFLSDSEQPVADFAPGESSWTLHLQRDALPLAAIYLLGPRYREAAKPPWMIEEVSPSEKLTALLTEAHCLTLHDAQRKRQMTDRFLTLTGSVPIFRLRMRDDLTVLPALTEFLLDAPAAVRTEAVR